MIPLAEQVKRTALANGANLVGIADAALIPEQKESLGRLLAGVKRIVVVVTRHSLSALDSHNNQARQFDTIHTYQECERAAHKVARQLEDSGHAAIAVPASRCARYGKTS